MKLRRKETALPDELLEEILVKVRSVESLVRLSCVCKPWRDLITDNPYIGEQHFKSSRNATMAYVSLKCLSGNLKNYEAKPENLLKMKTLNSPDNHPLPFVSWPLQIPFYTYILGSCNGILCLLRERAIHLYNPTIREHLILPPGLLEDDENYINAHVGFGFDRSGSDFKVVRFWFDKRVWSRALGHAKYVEIYRHSINCWTLLEIDSLALADQEINGDGVFVNGFFHWPLKVTKRILTFDLGAEKFGEVELIDSMGCLSCFGCLSVLDDSLAYICSSEEREVIEVWAMAEYGKKESWTKKLCVKISGEYGLLPSSFISCWVHDENRLEILDDDGYLITCIFDEGEKSAMVRTMVRVLHGSQVVRGVAFRPSLLSLRGRRNSKTKRKRTLGLQK